MGTDRHSSEETCEVKPIDKEGLNRRQADRERNAIRALLEGMPEGYELQHNPNEARYAGQMQQLAAAYRGNYISLTTEVERQVNHVLARIFAGSVEQQQTFERVVLLRSPGLSFSLKTELMLDGLRERHPGTYLEFRDQKLFTRLNAIREKRNRLAHAAVDGSPEYVHEAMRRWGTEIGEARFVGWTRHRPYEDTITVDEMQENYLEVNRVVLELVKLHEAVHGARLQYDEGMLEQLRDV